MHLIYCSLQCVKIEIVTNKYLVCYLTSYCRSYCSIRYLSWTTSKEEDMEEDMEENREEDREEDEEEEEEDEELNHKTPLVSHCSHHSASLTGTLIEADSADRPLAASTAADSV